MLIVLACEWCDDSDSSARTSEIIEDVDGVEALPPDPDGGFWYGERLSGAVFRVTAGGEQPEPVTASDVVGAEGDQRGLLGLAVGYNDLVGS